MTSTWPPLRAALVCALLVGGGCSSAPPLLGAYPSPGALAAAVLDGLARRDAHTLRALAISEQEFRESVYPRLPAARPERNLPFSYVWGDLRQKSEQSLRAIVSRHGGRRYELLDVQFSGDTDYVSYRVHREATVRVREAGGSPIELRICGSMIEQRGAWKVFSYIVDD